MVDKELISIILPVYNREKFIAESIQSILYQTYQNFELIIVDDASTDDTVSIINKFEDSRIKFFQLKQNRGVSHALNLGFNQAKGVFFARQDSDDISLGNRLELQVNFLNKHKEIDICGSWMKIIGKNTLLTYPAEPDTIASTLILRNPIASPTILFRKKVFEKFEFDESLRFGEDYDLLSKALFLFKAHNLNMILVLYRQHAHQLTKISIGKQKLITVKIQLSILSKFHYDNKVYNSSMLSLFLSKSQNFTSSEASSFLRFLGELRELNRRQQLMAVSEFEKILKKYRQDLIEKYFFRNNQNLSKSQRFLFWVRLNSTEKLYVLKRKIKKKIIFSNGKDV